MHHTRWSVAWAGLVLILGARTVAAESAHASAQILIIVPERPSPQARFDDPHTDPQTLAQSLVPPATAELVRENGQTVIRYTRVNF